MSEQDFSPGWLERRAAREQAELEAQRPQRLAFLEELNALCAKHGAYISDTGLEYRPMVVLGTKRYKLADDLYVEVEDP